MNNQIFEKFLEREGYVGYAELLRKDPMLKNSKAQTKKGMEKVIKKACERINEIRSIEIKVAKNEPGWHFTEIEILRELNDSRKSIIKDRLHIKSLEAHIKSLEANVYGEYKRVEDFEKKLAELKKKKNKK